jgi:glycosyltransferase involved in cell wall biosynthesis
MKTYINPEHPVPHMLIVLGFPVFKIANKFYFEPYQAFELPIWMKQARKVTVWAPATEKFVYSDELIHPDLKIEPLPYFEANHYRHWVPGIFYFFVYLTRLFRKMLKTNHIHVVGPGYPALGALLLFPFFTKKRKTYSYQKSWRETQDTTLIDDFQKKLLLKKDGTKNITVMYYGRILQAPKHMKLFFRGAGKALYQWYINTEKTLDEPPLRLLFADPLEDKFYPLLVAKLATHLTAYGTPVVLDFYADGPLKPELEALIKTMGAEDFIKVHNPLPLIQMMPIFRKAHLYVSLPDEEVWPEMTIRAMQEGCVPLHSRSGAILDFLFYGDRGVFSDPNLVDLTQAINDLYHYPENYQRMAIYCALYARDYAAPRLNRLITRLTDSHGVFTRHDLPVY